MNRLRAVLATGNSGKAAELSRLLGADVEARPIAVEEDAETYAGNALRKARAARAAADGQIGLGDDSGLEVAALGGEPGLHSARWTGPTDADRNAALLARLDGASDRSAAFVCSLAAVLPDGREIVVTERVEGDLDRGTAGRLRIRLRPALRAARRAAHGRGALARGEGRDLAPRARLARARDSTARGGCRVNAAALLLPFVVALPHGATAPPPGALPATARVTTLDRELGLALVRMPKRGLAPALRRLRAAPGVRYVERDAPVQLAAEGCGTLRGPDEKPDPELAREDPPQLSARPRESSSAWPTRASTTIAWLPYSHRSCISRPAVTVSPHDPIGHGTAVASILVANRPDVGVVGLVPDATLLSARIVRSEACNANTLRARSPGRVRLAAPEWRAGRERVRDGQAIDCARSNRCGHCSSRVRWSWPQSATSGTEPKPQVPGLAAGRARRRRARSRLLDTGREGVDARHGRRSRRAGEGDQSHRIERVPRRSSETRDHPRRHVVRDPDRDGRRGDGVGVASRLDGSRGCKCAHEHAPRRSRGWCRTSTPATASSM